MFILLEIEGLSMPMSREGGLVDNDIGDACEGGGGGSMDEKYVDMCGGGGSMEEEYCDTYKG